MDRRLKRALRTVDGSGVEKSRETLTTAQRRFAVLHHAEPGSPAISGTAVFFYCESGNHVQRWLVDEEGQVLDEEQFD